MWKPSITEDDLRRLWEERQKADRLYNDALTGVDHALRRAPSLPAPPPDYDEQQVAPLNEAWSVASGDPLAGLSGWRRRLGGFVWRLVGPVLQRQQQFNAALADHVNRNVPRHRDTRRTLALTLGVLAEELAALEQFEARLIGYLQHVTLYVDTKDRDEAGRARYRDDQLDHRTIGLAAGLSGLGEELRKRTESREQRLQMLERLSMASKRELEGLLTTTGTRHAAAAETTSTPGGDAVRATTPGATAVARLNAYKYVSFEDAFRGSRDEIQRRMAEYLPCFAGTSDVVDLGCGRGEFLEVLREHGIAARGVDLNHEMVEECRARGLEVVEADGLAYLRSVPNASIGGLFAAQVIEHLEPGALMDLVDVAFAKLRPSGRLVFETINPRCWHAFFESYIRDITHVRPIHPETLSFLLEAGGFERVEIRYSAPYPEAGKLQRVPEPDLPTSAPPEWRSVVDMARALNANAQKINALLFTYLDYAAVAERP